MKILVATNNKGKLLEIKSILGDLAEIISLKEARINIEVEEDGKSFEENASKKAIEIGLVSGMITISDDSGIEIPALNNWPGVYTKRLDENGFGGNMTDNERNRYTLEKCKNISDRTVIWKTSIAIYFPDKVLCEIFTGSINGILPNEPYGDNGFGFDSIFELEDKKKTIASLTAEEKNTLSPRKLALSKLRTFLENL